MAISAGCRQCQTGQCHCSLQGTAIAWAGLAGMAYLMRPILLGAVKVCLWDLYSAGAAPAAAWEQTPGLWQPGLEGHLRPGGLQAAAAPAAPSRLPASPAL